MLDSMERYRERTKRMPFDCTVGDASNQPAQKCMWMHTTFSQHKNSQPASYNIINIWYETTVSFTEYIQLKQQAQQDPRVRSSPDNA